MIIRLSSQWLKDRKVVQDTMADQTTKTIVCLGPQFSGGYGRKGDYVHR
jgi:hypothetical protein